ncbi:ATP-binding protein [Ruminococcus flavefaciens]|uniref:ATP-binding protein n=1 Tax=Ruminococcus flavefaciens TaxID=1265 RepID=UPI0002FBA414|nr:ATP-binding protein [Ruminococcus flavefaciens]
MLNNPMTIDELLNAKEGEQIQFKEAKNRFDFTEALKCCSALANCGGGKLVFGITDKRPRIVVGSSAFDQPERTRKGLIEKLKIMVDFQQYEHDGKRVLVFDVSSRPLGMPVQYDGIAWWYEGDSLIPMSEEIRRKIYEETGFDFSGSICDAAQISDLDENAIESFRAKWIEKSNNHRLASMSIEQILRDCEAITDEGVTYAALILFGKKASLGQFLPQCEIVFEYRSTITSGAANQRENFRMGFFACYDRLWELINLRNDTQHYQEGFFIFDIPTFNESVVREAILNAVSHRNYQLAGSIFIRQYSEKLVIESPGGLPHGITLDNILDRQIPRNRRIAEILALCGLVERSGQGMNIIYENCVKEAKQLPDFTGTDDFFVSLTLNGLIIDKKMLSLINKIGNERLDILTTSDFLTIDALYHERDLNETMLSRIKHLIDIGVVEHIGRGKYVLSRELYSVAGKAGIHTRVVGLDRETNKELLYKHIRKSGEKGSPLKELQQVLPSLKRSQIQVLLRELRKEERIHCIGNTNAARWYLKK